MTLAYIWNRVLKKLRGAAVSNSSIHHTSKVEAGSQVVNSRMDKYSYCGYDCKINNCEIGAFCSIADRVIIGGAQHPLEWVSTSPVFYSGRDSVKTKFQEFNRPDDQHTHIGNDVWVGDSVIIKAGISIGDGAIVGMGSVVTKSIGPYEIWAGNPARFIRNRFSKEIADELLASKWWDAPERLLSIASAEIRDPESFIKELYKGK